MELFRNSHVYTTRLNLALKVVVKHLNHLACSINIPYKITYMFFHMFLSNSYCTLVHTEIKHYHNWIWQPYCHSCQKKQRLNGYENWITISVFRGLSLGQNLKHFSDSVGKCVLSRRVPVGFVCCSLHMQTISLSKTSVVTNISVVEM